VFSEGRFQIPLPSHEDLSKAEREINNVLMLKHYIGAVHTLHNVLASAECRSNLCDRVRQLCSPERLGPMMEVIENNISPDALYSKSPIDSRNNGIWAIKVRWPPAWSILVPSNQCTRPDPI